MQKVMLLNGPNLGRLGQREPAVYGTATLSEIVAGLRELALSRGVVLDDFQSDMEGELVARIGAAAGVYAGIIFNPGAYAHTSVALRDALQAVALPCVEVHMSNTAARESFRQISLTASACRGQVMGFGALSYRLALLGLLEVITRK